MRTRRRRSRKEAQLGSGPPGSLRFWGARYVEWLAEKNYSPATVEQSVRYLGLFFDWCEARELHRPVDITRPVLERHLRYLFHLRRDNGQPLSFSSQVRRMVPVKAFFRWLTRQNVILSNPASDLELPKVEQRLPKYVLSVDEVEKVLAVPDIETAHGLRDRAMMEVLYSTAIRRAELQRLSVFDVDRARGTLRIQQGKGKKDRVVPIGARALAWVEKYLESVRSDLLVGPSEEHLFLSSTGEPMLLDVLSTTVRRYITRADIGKKGGCHLFRHTAATLMLENGAELRYIQELLGHAQVTTTEMYTRVSIRKLKRIHEETHPGAKLEPFKEGRSKNGPEEQAEGDDLPSSP